MTPDLMRRRGRLSGIDPLYLWSAAAGLVAAIILIEIARIMA